MIRVLRCLAIVCLICWCPSAAFAQSAPDWSMNVKLGKPLFVTLLNGDRIDGVAGSVTVEGVSVATPIGVRIAKFGDIRKVERKDSLWNGVWIGAAIGAGAGLVTAVSVDACPEYGGYASVGCSDERAALPFAGAIYGALIGWGIDALVKGRSTLFDSAGATRVSFAAAPRSVSGRLTVAW
ncbi:MAG: hypothetical protein ABIP65_07945 [Vicinamibacterales bacterium]